MLVLVLGLWAAGVPAPLVSGLIAAVLAWRHSSARVPAAGVAGLPRWGVVRVVAKRWDGW